MTQGRPPNETKWAYRSFQVLMVVENVSRDLTLEAPWMPTKWVLTDGSREWTDDYAWQWVLVGHDPHAQPSLPPGAKAEWTWMAAPVPSGAWVKRVEYHDPWGNLYSQELPSPPGGQVNFVDCGDPQDGTC